MKKLLAVFTATLMALSFCLSASAAEIDEVPLPESTPVPEDLPNPNGINIWLDGGFMSFEDAVPAIVDGRTQAPYRAVLEAMGAEVAYDDGKIEASFSDGSVISLAIGSKTMTCIRDGKVSTIEMDAAPYIDGSSGRTFVPVRFIGEALGLTVTWNEELQTAYMVDWDSLEASIDKRFSNFNGMIAELMKAKGAEAQGSVKSHDEIALSIAAGADPMKVSLKGDSVTDGVSSSGKYVLSLDLGGFGSFAGDDQEAVSQAIAAIDGQEIEFISSAGQDGADLYIRSQLVTLLTSGAVAQEDWLHVDVAAIYEQLTGVSLGQVIAKAQNPSALGDMTMGSLVRMLCEDGSLPQAMGNLAPDQAAAMFVSIYEGMFGDGQLSVVSSNGRTTYSVKCDIDSMYRDFVRRGLMSQADIDEIKAQMTMDFQLRAELSDGVLLSMAAKMDMQAQGSRMAMDISGTGEKMSGYILISAAGSEIRLDISTEVSPSDQQPVTQPSGGQVIPFDQLPKLLSQLTQQAA